MKQYLEQCGLSVDECRDYDTISEYHFTCGSLKGELLINSDADNFSVKLGGRRSKHFTEWANTKNYLMMIAEEARNLDIKSTVRQLSPPTRKFLTMMLARYKSSNKNRYVAKELFYLGEFSFVKNSIRELYARGFIYLTGAKPKLVYNFDKTKLDSLLP